MKFNYSREWLMRHLPSEMDASIEVGKESLMTTTVKVHVNGKYRATVTQDAQAPVTVEGNYNGGSGEKSFYLPHPAKATFVISEEHVKDGDERPA